MPRATDTIAAEANRLYWETETSVAEIAQQLELSRRALYDSVDPLPTSGSCEVCGSPLVFENRSARNAGVETCPACAAGEEPAAAPAAAPAPKRTRVDEEEMQRAVRVGGAALAGAALGAAATLFIVPRR
jgi:hypothetical protein